MKVAVVTGAAGGIGAATVERFKDDGWFTLGVDQTESTSSEPDLFLKLNLARPSGYSAIEQTLDGRRVDALINNAAVQLNKTLLDTTAEEWSDIFDVNVRAVALMIQAILPLMPQEGGAVVNVSSVHASATSPGLAAYAASKGAVVSLTRAAALELAAKGVRVNAVLPGAVDTPMLRAGLTRAGGAEAQHAALCSLSRRTALGRVGRPQEIAEAILFLADSSRSSYVIGQTLTVDGGALAKLSTE